ncbi:MAG TPA: hypothetical protein VGF28_02570 [Thermoanaerobaculia bacterium]|jgi:hypothetical protein
MSDPINKNPLVHQDDTEDMMSRIKGIVAERLPGIVETTVTSRRRFNSVAAVPDDFLEEIVVSIVDTPEAGAMNNITPVELRDIMVFSSVYLKFASRLETLAQSVRNIVAEKRYDVCQRALGVYGVVKGLRRPNRKPAQSNVDKLRRALGRGRRRKTSEPLLTDSAHTS